MQPADPLSTTFAALADPTRRAILARLAQGDASVKDLTAPFAMSQPAISKHLRVLERAGLIEQGRQAQWRPRRLRAAPLREIADWVIQYRRHWEESFERLDAYLRDLHDDPDQRKDIDDDGDQDRPRQHRDDHHLLGGR
jgi:DNA-binding transcriptional ArsR family regulator